MLNIRYISKTSTRIIILSTQSVTSVLDVNLGKHSYTQSIKFNNSNPNLAFLYINKANGGENTNYNKSSLEYQCYKALHLGSLSIKSHGTATSRSCNAFQSYTQTHNRFYRSKKMTSIVVYQKAILLHFVNYNLMFIRTYACMHVSFLG